VYTGNYPSSVLVPDLTADQIRIRRSVAYAVEGCYAVPSCRWYTVNGVDLANVTGSYDLYTTPRVPAVDVNSDCKGWQPGTHQNVSIGTGNTVVLEGPACTALRNVNVTLRCGVGSTVVLRGWGLEGGFVAIVGPWTATSLSIRLDNVTIAVDRSRIWAVGGPAVGVQAIGDNTKLANITINGLRFAAQHSDLRSLGSVSAAVLSVTAFPPHLRQLQSESVLWYSSWDLKW
jgi:hypothetical protein